MMQLQVYFQLDEDHLLGVSRGFLLVRVWVLESGIKSQAACV